MSFPPANRGPWFHRFLVWIFSIVLASLAYWLLGFVINDIGTWPSPSYDDLEASLLDKSLVTKMDDLRRQIEETNRKIVDHQSRQELLRKSISNSERTMQQLLDIQRLSLEKEISISADEQQAMADSMQRFLANQKQDHLLAGRIIGLNDSLQGLEEQWRRVDRSLEEDRIPIKDEWRNRQERHGLKLATFKLGVLIPLLIAAVAFFVRNRSSVYVPILYAAGLALSGRVAIVMHQHFPTRYFKYILIGVAVIIVLRILVYLLHMVAHPKLDWLVKQYRESYEAFLCPICQFPIRRGPLKYMFWNRRSIKKMSLPPVSPTVTDEAYSCPMCGTWLYEECESCHAIRHSLLLSCEKCGFQKSLAIPSGD